jgi:LuxR family quorum-sensing system transcriptional regulator CciR
MSRSTALRLTRILAGRSKEELKEAALAAAGRLGFPFLLFSGSFSQREIGGEIRFDNVPEEWHRQCGGRTRDLLPAPLRRQALQEVTPLLWSQAAPEGSRSLARARECGVATGVSCSVHGPKGQWSLTSFALPSGGAQAERHIVGVLPDCQLVACAIHCSGARIDGQVPDRSLPLRRLANGLLSERESQCLIESARGKTTSEIGQCLQISERTVAFHLANVRRKLDAANSRHAVSKALSLRLIATG